MRENRMRKFLSVVTGYTMFLIMTVIAAGSSVGLFELALFRSDNNYGLAAGLTTVWIAILAVLFYVIGNIRKRYAVDRPVTKILGAAERIARGDFAVRLAPIHEWGNYDEFDLIMENLNKMAVELSKTEILRADFIANVSHEIKTPLSVIQNYASALQDDQLSDEVRREYACTLVSTAKRITDLISNILKLNKLENQQIFPKYERIDLGENLAECVLKYEDVFERKNLRITCDFAENVAVSSDASFLDIIWNNLLSNAVKFTDAGGQICVRLRSDNGTAVVEVSDTGCGMTPETGARIFDKFYQGDLSHAQEGNGLGLALIKKVIDLIGGEIAVESRLGAGSRFTVKLRAERI